MSHDDSHEIFDRELEDSLVSLALASAKVASLFSVTYGLKPEHFYQQYCSDAFSLAVDYVDDDRSSGALALELTRCTKRTLSESKELLGRLLSHAPDGESFLKRDAAERIKLLAKWRSVKTAAERIISASESLDTDEMNIALQSMDSLATVDKHSSLSAKEWSGLLFDWLADEDSGDDAFKTPFYEINEALAGGLRRGELTVIGGYTGHGKSVLADQLLDNISSQYDESRCHLYISEMTFIERGQRMIARATEIPLSDIRKRNLSAEQYARAIDCIKETRYGISLTSGWSIDDLCRDIIKCQWDVAVVDLIHGFDYSDVYGLEKIMRKLSEAAKGKGNNRGTCLIATSHLNDTNADGKSFNPNQRPGLRSLKGSSAIKQYADNVMFVWREKDDGYLTNFGHVWTEKARQGSLVDDIRVRLDARSMRFVRR